MPNSLNAERFWVASSKPYAVDRDGYLLLETPELSLRDVVRGVSNSAVHELQTIPCALGHWQNVPALILLGEAGLGKTIAIQQFTDNASLPSQLVRKRIDTGIFGSEQDLINAIFDSHEAQNWLNGTHVLELWLDSFDECRLRVETIAGRFGNEMLQRWKEHKDRLLLRIACRSLIWPAMLEEYLGQMWPGKLEDGNKAVQSLSLCPLRRADVTSLVENANLNVDAWWRLIEVRNLHALTSRPLTLQLLIKLVVSGEIDIPNHETTSLSRYEVFRRGCLHLCREHNRNRRASGRVGRLNEYQRFAIAARFAAMSIFCGRPRLRLEDRIDGSLGEDEITINDILAGDITENGETDDSGARASWMDVREVLDTALFEAIGPSLPEEETPQTFAFSHRTYAEFLAAWHLESQGLGAEQITSLLLHSVSAVPGWDESLVVPQLAETAAWIAGSNETVRNVIFSRSPRVLLRCDLAAWDDDERAHLVEAILNEIEAARNFDDWELRRHYERFNHALLAQQLQPFIVNRSLSIFTRRAAIDIAEACPHGVELASVITGVALDNTDDIEIRIQAGYAVSHIGGGAERVRMRALALNPIPEDRQDELKGTALLAVWPDHATTRQVLRQIRTPDYDLLGAYRMFLNHFVEKLPFDDVSLALTWCAWQRSRIQYRDELWEMRRMIGGVFDRACEAMANGTQDPKLPRAFAAALLARFKHHDLESAWPIVASDEGTAKESACGFASLSDVNRRAIVKELVRHLQTEPGRYIDVRALLFSHNAPIWLRPNDLQWVLEQVASETKERLRQRWARLARLLFEGYRLETNADAVALVLAMKTKSSAEGGSTLEDEFRVWFEGMEINSPQAQEMKRNYEYWRKFEREQQERAEEDRRETQENHRQCREVIHRLLSRCEEGEYRCWWQLDRAWLSETSESGHFSDLWTHLNPAPFWKEADDTLRSRLLEAAQAYLVHCPPETLRPEKPDWMISPHFYYDIAAGHRALMLFWLEDRERLHRLSDGLLSSWARAVVWFPWHGGEMWEKDNHDLLDHLYQRVPCAVAEAVETIVRGKDARSQDVFVLRKLNFPWGRELWERLLNLAQDPKLQPATVAALLRDLMEREKWSPRLRQSAEGLSARSVAGELFDQAFAKIRNASKSKAAPSEHQKLSPSGERAKSLAMALLGAADDGGWPLIWLAIQKRPQWGQSLMLAFCGSIESRRNADFLSNLTEGQIADWFLWLQTYFPYSQDSHVQGFHSISAREQLGHFRDDLVRLLESRGTPQAIYALNRIRQSFAGHWAEYVLPRVREKALAGSWLPPGPDDVARLLRSRKTRFVSSGEELMNLIIESLQRAEQKLHDEFSLSLLLWNEVRTDGKSKKNSSVKFEPKGEEIVCNWLASELRNNIGGRGIVINREVVIRPSRGTIPGQRTDIYVDAILPGKKDDPTRITVIIEVKGNWNKDLDTAMETQLRDGYLKDNSCPHGLYVVAWFDSTDWNSGDYRRNKAHPKLCPKTKVQAQAQFAQQARRCSNNLANLRAFVLDCKL